MSTPPPPPPAMPSFFQRVSCCRVGQEGVREGSSVRSRVSRRHPGSCGTSYGGQGVLHVHSAVSARIFCARLESMNSSAETDGRWCSSTCGGLDYRRRCCAKVEVIEQGTHCTRLGVVVATCFVAPVLRYLPACWKMLQVNTMGR